MSREAMQMALDMLNEIADDVYCDQKLEEVITVLRQALSREAVKHIKTWSERCEEHPDHQERIITERMIQERMQEEIDELRQALEADGGNCYGDGTVYRGQRSKDSSVTEVTYEQRRNYQTGTRSRTNKSR